MIYTWIVNTHPFPNVNPLKLEHGWVIIYHFMTMPLLILALIRMLVELICISKKGPRTWKYPSSTYISTPLEQQKQSSIGGSGYCCIHIVHKVLCNTVQHNAYKFVFSDRRSFSLWIVSSLLILKTLDGYSPSDAGHSVFVTTDIKAKNVRNKSGILFT